MSRSWAIATAPSPASMRSAMTAKYLAVMALSTVFTVRHVLRRAHGAELEAVTAVRERRRAVAVLRGGVHDGHDVDAEIDRLEVEGWYSYTLPSMKSFRYAVICVPR